MNITKRAKIAAGALALAGAVTLTGGAFTASGLSTTGTASSEQFIGGTVSQDVVGHATLSNVAYSFANDAVAQKLASSVTLSFSNMEASNSDVSVRVYGGEDWIRCTGSGLTRSCDLDDVVVESLSVKVEAPGTFAAEDLPN